MKKNVIAKKLLENGEIDMRDINGFFQLSGVIRGQGRFTNLYGENFVFEEDSNAITFILDEVPFTFVEDPQDGYRSSLDRIVLSHFDSKLAKEFASSYFDPVDVFVEFRTQENTDPDELSYEDISYGDYNLVVGFDASLEEEKRILSNACFIVGTNHTDDYYPVFEERWIPENLSINQIQI